MRVFTSELQITTNTVTCVLETALLVILLNFVNTSVSLIANIHLDGH